jgi:hypothetical protein
MPNLASGDIIEATYVQRLNDQVLMNVLHFRYNGEGEGPDLWETLDEMNDELGTGLDSDALLLRTCQAENVIFERIRLQRILPTRSAARQYVYNLNGLRTGICDAQNLAATITKYTDKASHFTEDNHEGQVGSFHVGGLVRTDYAAGRIQAEFLEGPLADLALNLWRPLDSAGGNMIPVLLHRNQLPTPTSDQITGAAPQSTLRVMRRRTVGVGI